MDIDCWPESSSLLRAEKVGRSTVTYGREEPVAQPLPCTRSVAGEFGAVLYSMDSFASVRNRVQLPVVSDAARSPRFTDDRPSAAAPRTWLVTLYSTRCGPQLYPYLRIFLEVASTLPQEGWLLQLVDEPNPPTERSCTVGGLEWPQL